MSKAARASRSTMAKKAEAIAACRDGKGRITPRAVWQAARDPTSPLHGDFNWDVQRAAEQTWERTASELIRQVRFIIEYDDRKVAVPFYVSDPRTEESSYVATSRIAANATLSERVLRDELERITAAIRRALKLAAAFGLSSSFERMLEQATEIETRLGDADVGDEARA